VAKALKVSLERANVRRLCADWYLILDWVERGYGWTLAPSGYVNSQGRHNAVPVPLKHHPEKPFFAVYTKQSAKLDWFQKAINSLGRSGGSGH
jgi:DNA-binding transcriptional LysR family regulator